MKTQPRPKRSFLGRLFRRDMPSFSAVLMLMVISLTGGLDAAPYGPGGLVTEWVQPDGTKLDLRVFGDEFQARTETVDGYTVYFNPAMKAYDFAILSPDGQDLISSGVRVGVEDPRNHGLPKHLAIPAAAAKAKALASFEKWDQDTQTSQRWEALKAQSRALNEPVTGEAPPSFGPPSFTTLGNKTGLTLLIDFSDDPATIPQATIVDFCNGDNYTGYGNTGSVKKYFQDNSNNLLTYTNTVTAYIRMAEPKSYYNNISLDCGDQGNLLIKDAIAIMKALPNYVTEILPTFQNVTVDGDNNIVACNVFYAGGNGGRWSYGLWPHSWGLQNVGAQELSAGGMKVFKYQITNIGSSLEIGTFCHENGHMLCGYPDIYDYDSDSSGGAGAFCLMDAGGHGGNPALICAYLKRASGWTTETNLTTTSSLIATLNSSVGSAGYNKIYRYANPAAPTEYFLFENRNKSGRDADIPASGIAIWHIDELGDRDNQNLGSNTSHSNYEVTLVQADNLWDFQNDINYGDSNDLYYLGNSAAGYTNKFNDDSGPNAHWWSGENSGLNAHSFSAAGTSMSLEFGMQPNTIAIFAPNGGETIYTGTTETVMWGSNISGNVDVGLYKAGSLHTSLATNMANTGTFSWTVSPDLPAGNDYSLKITSSTNSVYFDFSDAPFAITTNVAPVFTVDPMTSAAKPLISFYGTLAATDENPGDTLTFSKVSGPAWLQVAANGSITGTPASSDNGLNVFTVSVTDAHGLSDEATLNITVENPTVYTWINESGGTWATSGNWESNQIANGSGVTANFGTLDLTNDAAVTLDGTRTLGNLSFGDTAPSHDWIINAGSPVGSLILAGATPTIQVLQRTATINAIVEGTSGLTKVGNGMLILAGANTYSGGTILHSGTLLLGNNSALGTGAVTINPGVTIGASTVADVVVSGVNQYVLNGNFSTYNSAKNIDFGTALVTINAPLSLAVANSVTFGGVITGPGGLNALDISGAVVGGTGYGLTFTAPITLLASDIVNPGNGATYSGVISDGGNGYRLTKTGTGGATLSGNNTFSGGVTLSAGTLTLGHSNALGTGTLTIGNGTTLVGGNQLVSNPLVLNGSFYAISACLTGPVTINAPLTLTSGSGSYFSGTISGPGGLNALDIINTEMGGQVYDTKYFAPITMRSDQTATANGGSYWYSEYAGAISDGGNGYTFTKAGTGKLHLSAANTFSGGLNITGGILKIYGAGSLTGGSFVGAVTNTGSFEFATSVNHTFTGNMSGSGSLTKSGAGNLTLAAANYSGATTLSNGTLIAASTTGSSAVTISNETDHTTATFCGSGNFGAVTVGATVANNRVNRITAGNIGTIGTLNIAGDLSFGAGSIAYFDIIDVSNRDYFAVTGNVTVATDSIIRVPTGMLGGAYPLIGHTGSYTGTFIMQALDGSPAPEDYRVIDRNGVVSLVIPTDSGWTGMGENANWSNATNWGNAPEQNDFLHFAGSTNTSPNNDLSGMPISAITFDAGAASFTIGGNAISLGIEIINLSSNHQTINLAMELLANTTLVDTGAMNVTLGGNLSGTSGLSKTGAGSLILSGANSYTGATSVSDGTLQLDGSLTSGAAVNVEIGGALNLGAASSIARNITVNGGTLNLAGSMASGTTLTLGSGSMATGPGAPTVAIVNLTDGAGTMTAVTPLTVLSQLKLARGFITITTDSSPFSVQSSGNLVDNTAERTFTLSGGKLTFSAISAPSVVGISYHQITDDATSGISSSNAYTHAVDFGLNRYHQATVNGVVFGQDMNSVAGGRSNPGTRAYGSDTNVGNTPPAVTGNVASIFTDMRYGGPDGYLELTGLGAGQWYDLRLYERAWDYNGSSRAYYNIFDVGADGSAEYTTPKLDQNRAYLTPPGMSGNVSWATSYVYKADNTGKIRAFIDLAGDPGATYHLYGMTNQLVEAVEGNRPLPDTHIAATSSSELNLGAATFAHTLGNLTLSGSNTVLTLSGAQSVSFNNVAASGSGSIGAAVPVSLRTGNVTVNNSQALTFSGVITNGDSSTAINKLGGGTLTLAGANTFTGNTTVNAGSLVLADNAGLQFVVTNSSSNQITGAGTATLNGDFTIDTTAVNATTGTWALVDTVTKSFGPTFSVAGSGWSETAGIWTKIDGGNTWKFSEVTGMLSLNPGFSAWAISYNPNLVAGQNVDGDGLSDLLEYAFGTNPLVSSAGVIAHAGGVVTSHGGPTTSYTNGSDFLAVFARRKDYQVAGLNYTVQFSAGLDFWVNSSATPTVIASDATIEAVSVPYPLLIPTARGEEKPTFFRIEVATP